jgi:CRP-like cAMP-binding protein
MAVSLEKGNVVLARLSGEDLELLRPKLQAIELMVHKRLETRGKAINFVHFPDSGIVSVVAHGSGERSIEVGLIGREGTTGSAVILGAERSAHEAFVQVEGAARRITTSHLRQLMHESASIRLRLLQSVHVFSVQTAQTALANGLGRLEERLARWLLMTHDRVEGNELPFTHEFLSIMLGVRRSGVTVALDLLENDGLIQRGRGVIVIFDREGLEAAACDFYGVPEAEMRRVMPERAPPT